MSDETARQIEYLIEVTQQDIQVKASLLADVVEGEVLVSEMLQDIKLDVADIKLGLFSFFEEEQLRFKIQQNQDKEANFRRLEELRELSRGLITGNVVSGDGGTRAAGDGGGDSVLSNPVVGGLAGGVAGGVLSSLGNTVGRIAKKLGIVGVGLVLFDQVTDFIIAFDEERRKLEQQGFDPDTVDQEAARSATQTISGNIYEGITDGIVIPVSEYALEQLAWSEEDIAEITTAIKDFKSAIIEGTGGFFDDVLRLFQEENVMSFEREAQDERKELNERIAGLKQDVANSPVSEESLRTQLNDVGSERLNFLMDQGLTVDDIQNEKYGKLSFSGRQQLKQIDERRDELRKQLQPFDQLAASQSELQELEARTAIARRGYETQSAVDRAPKHRSYGVNGKRSHVR